MAAKPKKVQLKDLAIATKSSVQAAVGKEVLQNIKPGILTGLVLNDQQLAALNRTPIDLAREIAKDVSTTTGLKVTPGIQKASGAVLVGYLVPRIVRK
jgi:hypothetical protein